MVKKVVKVEKVVAPKSGIKNMTIVFSENASETEKTLSFSCKEFKRVMNGFSVDGVVFVLSCPIREVVSN